MRWLIAAHEKEIPDFASLASDRWRPISVGVGQCAALSHLSALLERFPRPEGVLLVGTAGCLAGEERHRIYCVQHFAYPSIIGEELPEFLPRAFVSTPVSGLGEFFPATVVQNHGVSLDAEKFLQNTHYVPPQYPCPILENMEAASLAWLCNQWELPFSALLYTTNTIGPDARTQWKEHYSTAGEKLAALLRGVLLG